MGVNNRRLEKYHEEVRHDLYPLRIINGITKSMGHVLCVGEKRNAGSVLVRNLVE